MVPARMAVLPFFAPLPGPMVEHLLLGQRRLARHRPTPTLTSDLEKETGYSQAEWNIMLQRVRMARQDVYRRMNALVQQHALTTSWLLRSLNEATPGGKNTNSGEGSVQEREEISPATLKEWKDRGLITYQERNHPDVHQAAALLIARLVDHRIRNWLPTSMTPDEARTWCWRWDAPHLPLMPCPLPLPADLGKATLMLSAWAGRAWEPSWKRIDSIGAARWAGIVERDQRVQWDLTLEDLRLWDPQVAALHIPFAEIADDLLQSLADLALIRLAFGPLSSPPQYG